MSEAPALLATLKTALKAQGKTYADVSQVLELSEASVKRMFSENNFSLSRLEAVCNMLKMDISDLVHLMEHAQPRITHLTSQQEYEITQDLLLMLVAVCVLNHWTLEQIVAEFTISKEECIQKLLRLDKLNIIELLPENRVKLLISKDFKWLDTGPIERFFREHIGQEYFQSSFEGEQQCLMVLNGMLSVQSAIEFQKRLRRLAREFSELSRNDSNHSFEDKTGMTLVMAMRNWDFGLFQHLIRPQRLDKP